MFRDLRKRPGAPAAGGPAAPSEEFTCFFLHHAGGSSAGFLATARHFPPQWRLRAVDFPGRGAAAQEPPCRSTAEAVERLAPAFRREVDGPFAVFGHSMGALVGYELTRELERIGLAPLWLGVSAMPAPALVSTRFPDRRDLWSREQLVAFMRELGGTPDEMLEDADMVDYMVQILRNDLTVVDTYAYEDGPPLGVPLSVFSGAQDPLATPEMVDGWRAYSAAPVRFHSLPGGHFYLFEQAELLAAQVAEDAEHFMKAVSA